LADPDGCAGTLAAACRVSQQPVVGRFRSPRRRLSARPGDGGYVDGRSVAIEYRWANGRYERLPLLAADLVERRVAVLASTGGGPAMVAAKTATTTVPIVFVTGTDPVQSGGVASFNRPGGNLTGVYVLTAGLEAKRLGLLRELIPPAATIAVLMNPKNTGIDAQLKDMHEAGRMHGQDIRIFNAADERGIDEAFAAIAQLRPGALLVASDPYLSIRREQLVGLAARHAIPTMYQWREFAFAGGLMSYGTNLGDGYRQAGNYVAQILKGAIPADMPVVQPTRFELVINLKTATALGLTIPPGVLAIADEVIE
jgi:putative ABC transport system substrate-binding protein